MLGELHRAHPGIDLQLLSANARAIVGAVLEHDVELGLVEGPVQDGRLEVRPWREDELVVVVAPGHPLARSRRVTGPQLMEDLLLLREEGAGTREVMLSALRRRRWIPRRVFEVNSTEAIKGLVSSGVGWALLSARAVRDEVEIWPPEETGGPGLRAAPNPLLDPVEGAAPRPCCDGLPQPGRDVQLRLGVKASRRARASSPRTRGGDSARRAASRSWSWSFVPPSPRNMRPGDRWGQDLRVAMPMTKGDGCPYETAPQRGEGSTRGSTRYSPPPCRASQSSAIPSPTRPRPGCSAGSPPGSGSP